MYFAACGQLAEERPELRETIEAVDGLLFSNRGRELTVDFLTEFLTAPTRELLYVFESLQEAEGFSTRVVRHCTEHEQPLSDSGECDLCGEGQPVQAVEKQVLQVPTLPLADRGAAARQIPPRVLISYSHDSPEHAARVLELSDRLREHGVDCRIDQYTPVPSEGWPAWMERQIEEAAFVLCICSEGYNARFSDDVQANVGRGVAWEANLIRNSLYHLKPTNNEKFSTVQLDRYSAELVPAPLRGYATFTLTEFALDSAGYHQLYRHLTKQPAVVMAAVGAIVRLEQRPRRSAGAPERINVEPEPPA